MCSVGDDFENEGNKCMPSIEKIKISESKCNKCRTEIPIVLLRHKDAYCKNCFLTGTTHKFKALLGKSKLIRPNDRVLVSYEVGHASTALLHLLRTGLDLSTQKKLRFEPIFVFLEDQFHLTLEERQDMVRSVIKEADGLNFEINIVSFAEWFVKQEIKICKGNEGLSCDDKDEVNRKIASKANATYRKEILSLERRNCLISTAKKLGCQFVFTPELSSDLAASLLTNLSLGRGCQVPVDTGFCDDRDPLVRMLRPLRSFDMKEAALYNVLNKLQPVAVRQPLFNQYASIQSLMKQFIGDLQENYPATVATVVRTGDKLALDSSNIVGKCTLCKGALLCKSAELSSQESTNFSRLVSNQLPDHSLSREERYSKIRDTFDGCNTKEQELCFSCSRISEFLLKD